MAMNFEELDDITRRYMLAEFELEQVSGNPYPIKTLTQTGLMAFPDLMREAIRSGNEETLQVSFMNSSFWKPIDSRGRRVNMRQAAERLAITEFNTWYVRGLTKRLIDEGVTHCQVYRASSPRKSASSCTAHEDRIFLVREVYDGHRARYWPKPGNPNAITIPFGPACHHTIRRVQ